MTRVREAFIKKQVLDLFMSLPAANRKLPFDVFGAANNIKNCRVMSYSQFANLSCLPPMEVASILQSEDGSTHYDPTHRRFLISYNDMKTEGRVRFTIGHEIGHILLGHLENPDLQDEIDCEKEADWFASMLLCPFPVIKALGISSASDLRSLCGISSQAADIKIKQYTDWRRFSFKTAWDNDILKTFRPFLSSVTYP